MLILSRYAGEEIVIGDDIVLRVCELRGDQVRLGFVAPRGVTVHRREVWAAIHRGDDAVNRPGT
jgi:carbon storage regulator